jgi:DNA invertase Pin-like site-specific DNA recombinase
MSGTRHDRAGLAEILSYVRRGDTVVVVALDRTLRGIVETVAELDRRGIVLHRLCELIDTSTWAGEMLVVIFGSLTEYERSLITEHCTAPYGRSPAYRPARPPHASPPASMV